MRQAAAPLLRVENLSASYGNIEALKAINLEVFSGELVAVLGPNGAGKSTLMKAILRLIDARGDVLFDGARITLKRTESLAEIGIMLVPEGRGILGPLTVRENLDLGAYARHGKAPAADIAEDLEAVYKLFPRLKEREHQLSGLLSGGEQQMLAVGRALMARPRLLLLDEPSLGLAPRVASEIVHVLGQLNESGLTILLVEQKAPLALQKAHRAYVMRTGEIVAMVNPKDFASTEQLARLYLGQIH